MRCPEQIDGEECGRDVHVRSYERGRVPTTPSAWAEYERRQSIIVDEFGCPGETGLEVDLAAATEEAHCPLHGVVWSQK
jgi:hypothetical protein